MINLIKQMTKIWLAIGMLLSIPSAMTVGAIWGMTYRDNEVIFNASNGLRIHSGTFSVNELNITSGQDPQGRNYVGQIHHLNNNRFNFSVGRSGTAGVANWFSQRFSGYNDPGVINGDRTTFGHTPGALNFAFIGDLTLELSGGGLYQQENIFFPNVGIAQGSTALSNNWWFGQTIGQRTKNSDSADTILALGTKQSTGQKVYASFLRGGNGVNTISLVDLMIVGEANHRNARTSSIAYRFENMPVSGTLQTIEGLPTGNFDPIFGHYQGIAQFGTGDNPFVMMTYNTTTHRYAHIIAGRINATTKSGFRTFRSGLRHPGGIDTQGDFLVVPNENDTEAWIAVYDMRSLYIDELRRMESFALHVPHKAGALGITDFVDNDGNEWFLLVLGALHGANSIYYVYRASADVPLYDADFQLVGELNLDGSRYLGRDYQGFGLLTDEDNNVFMAAMWTQPVLGLPTHDFVHLYGIDTNDFSVERLSTVHVNTHMANPIGVHFRYGAGARIIPNTGEIQLLATERNFHIRPSRLRINHWNF